jgi:hypothetical protein
MAKLFVVVVASIFASAVWAGNWNNGGKAKTNQNNCIDEESRVTPTLRQLELAFIYCYDWRFSANGRLEIEPSSSPAALNLKAESDSFIEEQLQTTGLVSYILYRDGMVIRDAISPEERLGKYVNNETRLISNSIGKSLTSYLLGHSICRGDIPSLDHTISDWPLLQNTLYEQERLADLINMNVGDTKYFQSHRVNFDNPANKKGVQHESIGYWGDALRGTRKPLFRSFNYSQMVSASVTNYVAFKARGGFEGLLREVYVEKARISSTLEVGYVDPLTNSDDGIFSSKVWATRYDYLRIAIAMLNDWRSNNCVGKYLKEIHKNRVKGLPPSKPKRHMIFRHHHKYQRNYDYAGFFHTNVSGTRDNVFIMHGYGGQIIAINFDSGTIVVAHSVHEDWDTARLVIDAVNGDY